MAERELPQQGSAPASGRRTGGVTTDRLRAEIDAGLTGDKVAYPDPAAAPLGTDDEAAGSPPSREAVAASRDRERATRPVREQSSARDARYGMSTIAMVLLVVAVAIVAIAAIWVMA